ncbi:MAG: hypothetical protein DHS80DRAFT_30623 [Piptocephalis tieghemiana]|nr:MAG: hypothetical protein DHS80DRAFT_30623 [Piptocephalis tieghemiana]
MISIHPFFPSSRPFSPNPSSAPKISPITLDTLLPPCSLDMSPTEAPKGLLGWVNHALRKLSSSSSFSSNHSHPASFSILSTSSAPDTSPCSMDSCSFSPITPTPSLSSIYSSSIPTCHHARLPTKFIHYSSPCIRDRGKDGRSLKEQASLISQERACLVPLRVWKHRDTGLWMTLDDRALWVLRSLRIRDVDVVLVRSPILDPSLVSSGLWRPHKRVHILPCTPPPYDCIRPRSTQLPTLREELETMDEPVSPLSLHFTLCTD